MNRSKSTAPYRCSAQYFWAGLLDWWQEKLYAERHPDYSPSSDTGSDKPRKGLGATLLAGAAALALLGALAVVVATLAPALSKGVSVVGTANVAWASVWAVVGLSVALFAVLPLWLGWKFLRFSKAMCRRGWQIHTGQRVPFSLHIRAR